MASAARRRHRIRSGPVGRESLDAFGFQRNHPTLVKVVLAHTYFATI